MSQYNVDDPQMSVGTQNALRRLSAHWWIFLIQGIAAVILGVLLLTNPAATAISLVVLLGAYWLVDGIMDFVRLFTDSSRQWGWNLVLGVLGVVSGILVLQHPLISTVATGTFLVAVLAVGSIVMGIVGILRGVREDGWGSIVIGVVNLLVGLWLLFNPLAAIVALPLVLGVFALVGGVLTIINAFRLKNLTV